MHRQSWHGWLMGYLLCALFIFSVSETALAAGCASPVSLTDTTAYTQNFDELASTGTTNILTLSGWCLNEVGTSALANGQYSAGSGIGNSGDVYSFGTTGRTDRALGSRLSSTLTPSFGVSFVNNTGRVITGFQVSYRGEQWSLGSTGSTDRLDFQYSLDATDLSTGVWTQRDSLDFTTLETVLTGSKDGNSVTILLSDTISDLNIPDGSEFSIRWVDVNANGADDGLAVDDFSLTLLTGAIESTPTSTPTSTLTSTLTTTPTSTLTTTSTLTSTLTTTPTSTLTATSTQVTSTPTVVTRTPTQVTSTPTVVTTTPTQATSTPTIVTRTPTQAMSIPTIVTTTPSQATITPTDDTIASIRIRDLQGISHLSPLIGTAEVGVRNVPGIVTAKRSNGFYLQDPDLSNDTTGVASSEAIFVFTGTSPAGVAIRDSVNVGDPVLVSGTLTEFRPGFPPNPAPCNVRTMADIAVCSGPGLSVTEIVSRNAQALVVTPWACTGACTITPTIIGSGGRIPPAVTLNTEAANIETGGMFNADADGIDFYESLEGMRVTLNAGARVVGPSASFTSGTEVWVVADNFANSNNTPNPRGGLTISEVDYHNPERIRISTKTGIPAMGAALPNLNVGASIDSAVQGIIDYSFNNFEVISLSTSYDVTQSLLTKEVTSLVRTGPLQLTIATFNVENLGGNASAAVFETRADVIVNNLLSPDIVVLEEMQDNNGQTAGGQAADTTFAKLIDAIVAIGGPNYEYRQIDPSAGNLDGGAPNGNIRIGFLFRTDRSTTFVSRPAGDFDDALAITCDAGVPTPNLNPGRIDPANPAFSSSRKPTMGEFVINGETFFIIGNHWNSKGGDNPMFGNTMPPVEASRTQRNQQATVVRDFVNSILACDPTANVIIAGDLNDFQFSPPVATLVGTTPALTVMNTLLPVDERYSYVYQGTAQSLDHVVVSSNVLTQWDAQYDTVHVNAEFFDQVSDHDPSLILLTTATDLQQSPMPLWVTSSTPTLNWSQLTWATGYEVQIDESSTFETPVIYATAGTSVTIPSPGLTTGTFYWRVRGQSALGGQFGAFSPVSAFTVEV